MKRLVCGSVLALALGIGGAAAQQIQTGTPRDTGTSPTQTNGGTSQPAATNPSTETMTGTAGSAAEQARSGAHSVSPDPNVKGNAPK